MSDNPHYVTPEQARKKDCCMKVGRYFCKGTDCMAWRWKETADWKEGSDLRVVHSKTHGYCGMVRQ